MSKTNKISYEANYSVIQFYKKFNGVYHKSHSGVIDYKCNDVCFVSYSGVSGSDARLAIKGSWVRIYSRSDRFLLFQSNLLTLAMAGCHRSLIQPYLWLVATYLTPKGSRRFYGRDLVGQPARASASDQRQLPAAASGWPVVAASQPTQPASQPVITSYNYHNIVLNPAKMLK